jgi:NlpC/P60 family putative phage cell wall peptidase
MAAIEQNLPAKLIPCADIYPLTAEREATLRAKLIAEARSWIGTPYRQLGAIKGIAVDCSMLLVRCVIDAGIVEPFDPRPYPPAWFLHQDDERYIDWLGLVAVEISTPKAGDIVAFKIGRAFAHSGIVTDPTHLVHAFADERQVSESPLFHPALAFGHDGKTPRPRRAYDFFARLRQQAPPGTS